MILAEFLAEYERLKKSVPRVALINTQSENSAYTQYAIANKNCYLCFGSDYNEDCYYGYWIYTNKDCVDCSFLNDTEIAYECIDVRRCYNAFYSQDCTDCRDVFLCYDGIGLSDCFGCTGLRKTSYQIFNKQYSKEEYTKEVLRLREKWKTAQGREKIMAQFQGLKEQTPHVFMHQLQNEGATGDYIYNSKNCEWSFDILKCEDSAYLYNAFDIKNCSDCSFAKESELLYECMSCYGVNFNFCYVCWNGSNLDFCELCFNCSDLLGCIGLKNKRFCILNKQYSPEEYKKVALQLKADLKIAGWYSGKLPAVFSEA